MPLSIGVLKETSAYEARVALTPDVAVKFTELKAAVPDAPKILLRNVYGWFVRVDRGVYGLTQAGTAALARWPQLHA